MPIAGSHRKSRRIRRATCLKACALCFGIYYLLFVMTASAPWESLFPSKNDYRSRHADAAENQREYFAEYENAGEANGYMRQRHQEPKTSENNAFRPPPPPRPPIPPESYDAPPDNRYRAQRNPLDANLNNAILSFDPKPNPKPNPPSPSPPARFPSCPTWREVVASIVSTARKERVKPRKKRYINSTMDWYCEHVRIYQENYRARNDMDPPYVFWSDYKRGNLFVKLLKTHGYFDANVAADRTSPFYLPGAPPTRPSMSNSRTSNNNINNIFNNAAHQALPPLNISLFLLKSTSNHQRYGYSFGFPCEGQLFNHIPGEEHIGVKDKLIRALRDYERELESSGNGLCVSGLQPKTFLMSDVTDCKALFSQAEREWSKSSAGSSIAYISKHAQRHNGKALILYTKKDMKVLSHIFDEGNDCGKPLMRRQYQFFPGVMAMQSVNLKDIPPQNASLDSMMQECDSTRHCNAFTSTGVLMNVPFGPETYETVTADLRHGMYIRVPRAPSEKGQRLAFIQPLLPSVLVQQFMPNPLTIDGGHKFDLRVYLIIASTDPFLAFYHEGFLRVSLSKYNPTDPARSSHITNTALAKEQFKNNTALAEFQMRSFEQLQRILLREGVVDDPSWVWNTLEPRIKTTMVHIVKAVAPKLTKRRGLFGIYGCDFMIDTNLKVWFIEANRSPAFQGTTKAKGDLQRRMLSQVMSLVELLAEEGPEALLDHNLKSLQPILYSPRPTSAEKTKRGTRNRGKRGLESYRGDRDDDDYHDKNAAYMCGESYFGLFGDTCSAALAAMPTFAVDVGA